MSQENYRYIRLDSVGDLHSAEAIYAANDGHAAAQVRELHPNDFCEVWMDNRLVATLKPSGDPY